MISRKITWIGKLTMKICKSFKVDFTNAGMEHTIHFKNC